MNQSESDQIASSLMELFLTWFFGLLWGLGLYAIGGILMLAIVSAVMGNGHSYLNWFFVGIALFFVVLSPIVLLLMRTRRWIRGFIGGGLANAVGIIVFVVVLFSQNFMSKNGLFGLGDNLEMTLSISISASFVILTMFLSGLKPPNIDYFKLFSGIGLGFILAIGLGHFLEQRLLQQLIMWKTQIADISSYTLLIIPPLVWLYSMFFIKIFSGNSDQMGIFLTMVFVLILTGITCGLPFISGNLFLYYLNTYAN